MFTTETKPDYLQITFDDPASANALSLTAARELAKIQREFRKIGRPVVVRTSRPGVFCSGGNLKDHHGLRTRAEGLRANAEITRHLNKFAEWPVPKLAIVAGAAVGGGVEWLARFDVRWATPDATLTFGQKRVGLSFGWGGGAAWSRWIGEARVRQLLLEARRLDARAAVRLGLIDRLVNAAELDGQIAAWARDVASPINAVLLGWRVKSERLIFGKLWGGAAHRAALAAFARRVSSR